MKNLSRIIIIGLICASPSIYAADILSHAVLNLPYELRSVEPWVRYINTQEEWELLYNEMVEDSTPFPSEAAPAPVFDFETYQLIAGGLGEKCCGGHRIAVESVIVISMVYVNVLHVKSGTGCAVTQAVNYPSTAILIPKTDKPIQIYITEAVHDCS